MKSLVRAALVGVAGLLAGTLQAADSGLLFSFVPPSEAVRPGGTAEVQVVVLNRSAGPVRIALPAEIPAALVDSRGRWPAVMRPDGAAPVEEPIAAGGFVLRRYRLELPGAAAAGPAMLEASWADTGVIRTAVAIEPGAAESAAATQASQRPTTNLVRAEPVAAALRRTFADRLAPHEPLYFIYGPDEPGAKFQFSFKYKLLDFGALASQRMARTLQFAFTQRSLWNINGVSSPFYDTSYMPELIYQSLVPENGDTRGWFHWLGFQAAYKHESNGRDGPLSRSVNGLYARPVFAVGSLDRWHLLAIPELFAYLGTLEDNPEIKHYRGYGKLRLVFGRNDGPTLLTELWAGKNFNHLSAQFDLTIPIRTRLLNFETYLLVQYFNGFGESLLSYQQETETIRAGFSLVR